MYTTTKTSNFQNGYPLSNKILDCLRFSRLGYPNLFKRVERLPQGTRAPHNFILLKKEYFKVKKMKSTKLLTALLLVGVCVLGVTLIVHAIDIEVIFTHNGFNDDNPVSKWKEKNEEDLAASCYIFGSFMVEDGDDEDDEPDIIGGIHAQGMAWTNDDLSVTLFSYAYSTLYDPDIAAKANAWIKFPRQAIIPHPDGPGEVDVGAGADKMGVTIYDTRTFQQGDKWGWLKGSASLRVPDLKTRIQVKYEARVVLEEEEEEEEEEE